MDKTYMISGAIIVLGLVFCIAFLGVESLNMKGRLHSLETQEYIFTDIVPVHGYICDNIGSGVWHWYYRGEEFREGIESDNNCTFDKVELVPINRTVYATEVWT